MPDRRHTFPSLGDIPPTLWYIATPPVTYKFVFDPQAQCVRPLAAAPPPPRRPLRAHRRHSGNWALVVVAVVASLFGYGVMQAAIQGHAAATSR